MMTQSARDAIYYTHQAEVLQALDALKALVLAHEATATTQAIHWGHIGDLAAIREHLTHLPISMTPKA